MDQIRPPWPTQAHRGQPKNPGSIHDGTDDVFKRGVESVRLNRAQRNGRLTIRAWLVHITSHYRCNICRVSLYSPKMPPAIRQDFTFGLT